MTTSIKTVSQEMVSQLSSNSALDTFRKALRSDSSAGKTERKVFLPRLASGRFDVRDIDAPYLCVASPDGQLFGRVGDSRDSELGWSRVVLGVLGSQNPTYERDAQLKELFELTVRAVASSAMLTALQALGVRRLELSEYLLDGLSSDDQAICSFKVSMFFAGRSTG